MAQRGELFSARADTDKRTYFFNVKENRVGDMFLNIVESRKRESPGGHRDTFERQSVVIYEEDLRAFVDALDQALDYASRNARLGRYGHPASGSRESRSEREPARSLRDTGNDANRRPRSERRPALSGPGTSRPRVTVRRRTR